MVHSLAKTGGTYTNDYLNNRAGRGGVKLNVENKKHFL